MRKPADRPRLGEQGVALLIVLWGLVPLAVLFLTLSTTARSEAQAALDLRTAAVLQAAADGAIYTAVFGLLSQGGAPAPVMQASGVGVTVEAIGLSGFVNPNTAPAELLQALLTRVGAEPGRAKQVATAIVEWRTPGQRAGPNGTKAAEYRQAGLAYGPPGAPFESLDELGLVRGVDPALLAALAPSLSLYAYGPPDPQAASPLVRQALRDIGMFRGPGAMATQVYQVTAVAAGPSGTRAVRRATIRIGPSPDGRGWRVLTWDTVQGQ